MARSKIQTFCPHCGSIVPAGRTCPCRKRKRKPTPGDATRGEREPWRREYRDPQYQRNRQAVIERQRGRCIDCGEVCASWDGSKWATKPYGGEVDHEVPLCEGGTSSTKTMALRCKRCHGKAEAKRRAARAARRRPRS